MVSMLVDPAESMTNSRPHREMISDLTAHPHRIPCSEYQQQLGECSDAIGVVTKWEHGSLFPARPQNRVC